MPRQRRGDAAEVDEVFDEEEMVLLPTQEASPKILSLPPVSGVTALQRTKVRTAPKYVVFLFFPRFLSAGFVNLMICSTHEGVFC